MHFIEIQYFRVLPQTQKNTAMHDLPANYLKIFDLVKEALEEYLADGKNLQFYPNAPKMSDVEIISLAITAECLGIDSENLLWVKIKKNYAGAFPNLPHRTRYNARRKKLLPWISFCADKWSMKIGAIERQFIVDSIPIPICKICREKRSRVCRRADDALQAAKGYNPTEKQYYIGFKLHLVTCKRGVYQHASLLPANVHDIQFAKMLPQSNLANCQLIGDCAYRSAVVQLELFKSCNIDLNVPYRRNQKDYQDYSQELRIKRKRIETLFSQYCDDFMLKRNYAKGYNGLLTRIFTKIAGMTFKQFNNYLNGKSISKTKHSLAA